MKKTLAILLALLAAASVTLASCNNKKKPVENGGGYYEEEDDTSDSSDIGGGNSTSDGGNSGTIDIPTDPNANYVDKNDVIYAGVELKLRATPSTSGTAVKTVPFGTKLNRSQSNGTWDKITLDGESTVYYVRNEWTTPSNANFQFEDCEDSAVTVKTTDSKVQFYLSPFVHNDLQTALQNAYLGDGFKASDFTAGYNLTRVAMNGAWVKVTFTGTVKGKTLENATFYIQAMHFTNGRLTDPTFPGQGGNDNPGGLG